MSETLPLEAIEQKIYVIRGQRVMIDRDLAFLYGVEARVLNQAVKRNAKRFPDDFMFQLNDDELAILKSQIVISRWGGDRANPYVFTEQGVSMLSSVLRSSRAIQVNIAIMRAFVRMRKALSIHKDLIHQLKELERRVGKHDGDILIIFEAIRKLMEPPPEKPRPRIGFRP